MNRWRNCLFLTLCVLALLSIPLYGQKTTGQISGSVTDPSGAVVANAAVTVLNTATGQTRTASTDTSGAYSVPDLTPGMYQVTIKAPSFKESVAKNVEVHVATSTSVNMALQMGGSTETVEVTTNAVQVQTDSAVLGETIDSTQVSELPLNGRNFMGLTQLAPGVSTGDSFSGSAKGLSGGVDFSVNGNAVTNNLYLVDGANNNDRGSNRTILIYPSVDSIAEFKMLQNSYGPEYGQAAGAVITMVTKSGTNAFHGGVFYAGRNDALNAWDYFAKHNAGGTKGKLRRNDYGFNIGGPAIKDKLFFFYSQEWNKEIRGVPVTSCVPSADERAGDFSNPSCGAAKPVDNTANAVNDRGSLIPLALQDPTNPFKLNTISKPGQDFIAWFPQANQPDGHTWTLSANANLPWRQENARVDFNLTKNNVLMGRYTQDNWSTPNGGLPGNLWGDSVFPTLNSAWAQPSKMIIGKMTSTIGSSIVNDVEFSYSNNRIIVTPSGTNPGLLTDFTNDFPTLYPANLKNAKQGVPTVNGGWGGFTNYGAFNGATTFWMQAPWSNALDMYSVRDDVSKVSGNHTYKAGVLLTWDGKNEDTASPSAERIGFSTTPSTNPLNPYVNTGNQLLNVMVPGMVFDLSETSTNIRSLSRWRDYEFYVADTWKARKNLTIDYGVRYSLLFSPFQPNKRATSFQPFLYDPNKPATDACNGLWTVPGTHPCADANALVGTNFSEAAAGPNKYLQDQNHHLFAPRLGIAWDPSGTGNWAIRAGVGQFFQRDRVSPSFINFANAPFAVSASGVPRTLDGPTPASVPGGASPSGGTDPSANISNSWQWNLALEHSFAKETALQIAYVGNSAIHQLGAYDINIPDPTKNVNCALGNTLFANVPTWTCGAFGNQNTNISNVGKVVNGYTLTTADILQPFANYGRLAYWSHDGHATYHAFQTVFKTKYKRSQLTAAYTWSHSIGNVQLDNSSGGLDQNSGYFWYKDKSLDRGNTPINRPNIFVASGTYFFPELKGSNGFMRGVLGGWEMSGITQATSGHSVGITQNISEDTANLNGTSFNPSNAIGVSLNSMVTPLKGNIGCNSGVSGSQIMNPQAFTLIGQEIGTLSDKRAPRGYCAGPRFVNTDFSIDKNWKLTEKFNMQFRMDFFDIFNHANFRGNTLGTGNPVNKVNCGPADNTGKYAPCSPINNVVTAESVNPIGSGFGATSGTVGNHGRELQYTLRITF